MNCDCPDWAPNTKILNGYVQTSVTHGMGDYKAQNGKPFVFCPWCGNALNAEDDETKAAEAFAERAWSGNS